MSGGKLMRNGVLTDTDLFFDWYQREGKLGVSNLEPTLGSIRIDKKLRVKNNICKKSPVSHETHYTGHRTCVTPK